METVAKTASSGRNAPRPKAAAIREMCFEDYDQVAALQARNGACPRPRDQWNRLWTSNPGYRVAGRTLPMGWVVENKSGEITGSIANIPFLYSFRRRLLRVAAAADWVVDGPYRGYALPLMARLMSQEHADVLLTTTVSANAEAVFSAFGWRRAPGGTWNKSAFWVAKFRGFAAVVLRNEAVPFATALSYPGAALLLAREWLRTAGVRRDVLPARVEVCEEFDSRFDDFWVELERQNEGVFLSVRTRDTLAWHFAHLTPSRERWILAAFSASHLVAYAVFDRKDNAVRQMTRVRIIDFQALKGFEALIGTFLECMLNECRRRGIHVLENVGCWLERPDLPRVHIAYRRDLPAWTFCYKANSRELAEALEDPRVWVSTSFDGDVSL